MIMKSFFFSNPFLLFYVQYKYCEHKIVIQLNSIQYFIKVSPYAYIHKITNNKIKHAIHIYTQTNQYRFMRDDKTS